jgi:hypothetical protein
MVKKLELLLKVIITILIVGFAFTTMLLAVNESEIAFTFAAVTSCLVLTLLFIAIAMDIKIN